MAVLSLVSVRWSMLGWVSVLARGSVPASCRGSVPARGWVPASGLESVSDRVSFPTRGSDPARGLMPACLRSHSSLSPRLVRDFRFFFVRFPLPFRAPSCVSLSTCTRQSNAQLEKTSIPKPKIISQTVRCTNSNFHTHRIDRIGIKYGPWATRLACRLIIKTNNYPRAIKYSLSMTDAVCVIIDRCSITIVFAMCCIVNTEHTETLHAVDSIDFQ